MKPTYVVNARRSGRWWAIDVPEVRGAFSQARRLAQVEPMARDEIAGVLDVSPRSFSVLIRPVLEARLQASVHSARDARVRAHEAELELAETTAKAVRLMQRNGVPLRDAGELLGISHQRAAQLIDADLRAVRTARRKAIAELRAAYDFADEHSPLRDRSTDDGASTPGGGRVGEHLRQPEEAPRSSQPARLPASRGKATLRRAERPAALRASLTSRRGT